MNGASWKPQQHADGTENSDLKNYPRIKDGDLLQKDLRIRFRRSLLYVLYKLLTDLRFGSIIRVAAHFRNLCNDKCGEHDNAACQLTAGHCLVQEQCTA